MAFEPITNDEIEAAMMQDVASGIPSDDFSREAGVDVDGFNAVGEHRTENPFFVGVLAGITLALVILRDRGIIE